MEDGTRASVALNAVMMCENGGRWEGEAERQDAKGHGKGQRRIAASCQVLDTGFTDGPSRCVLAFRQQEKGP